MAFVATSAPQGWKLGRWSQVSKTEWQEEKLDDPKIVWKFQVLSGPTTPGSQTMRLKMKDQNTEVLLLDSSAQVFVGGNYLGEYVGEWQSGSKGRPAAAPPARQSVSKEPARQSVSKEPAPAPAPAARGSTSKQEPAFEQTLAPAQAAPQKAEKPAKKEKSAPAASAYSPGPPPASVSVNRADFQPWQDPSGQRKGKAPGLDKSEASIQKLIGAAKNGDAAQVKQLLESGIDPDGPAKDGQTPLMAATRGGHIAVVEALLGACADPTLGKGEETPLTIAFQKGNQNLLKVLFAGSFNNLNSMVGPNDVNIQSGGLGADSSVPENAEYELREMTAKIASLNSRDAGPSSPAGGKYGNYAHLTASADMESKDSDLMRAEAVKMTMKSLAKTNKNEGGMPTSPKSPKS